MQDQKGHWDSLHGKGALNHYKKEPSFFAKEVTKELKASSRILELGCGAGSDANYFASLGHTVTATDFSDIVIGKNKKHFSAQGLSFKVVDMEQPFPFENDSFEAVYARLSLHYFSDKKTREIFSETARVLGSGGKLFFICKSVNDPLYGKGTKIEDDMFENNGHIRHFFSENYAKELLEGFKIEKLESGEEKFYDKASDFVKVKAKKI